MEMFVAHMAGLLFHLLLCRTRQGYCFIYCYAGHGRVIVSFIAMQDIFLNLSFTSIVGWIEDNWYWVLAGFAGLSEWLM